MSEHPDTRDNPVPLLLGVSAWWWAAGAAAAAVAGYLVFRKPAKPAAKGLPPAAKPAQQGLPPAAKPAQGIPLASFASPADYVKSTAAAVGGYGSAYEAKPWASRRTSMIPQAVRDVWWAQEREFAKRRFVLSAIRQKAAIPTTAQLEASAPTGSAQIKGARNYSPPEQGFSTQKFLVFRPQNHAATQPMDPLHPEKGWVACGGPQMGTNYCEAVWGWNPTDEFGNAFEGWGVGSDPFNTVMLIVQTVLPYIPGVGSGAAAALAGVIALGQGKSLDEAALAGARAALPAGAQLAFDLGVGVAQGKPVDQALTDVALSELEKKYPGSKAAYNQGKQMANQSGLGVVIWKET